jgi:hypothetical protein
VRQGRTDAWIAHKLDIAVDELTRFKREHQLDEDDVSTLRPADPLSVEAPEPAAEGPDDDEELDRAEPDEDRPPRRERDGSRRRSRPPRRREPRAGRDDERGEPRVQRQSSPQRQDEDEDGEQLDGEPRRRRRRGRRGGRRHRARRNAFEATFDHGEEDGYGLWLDPAVVDNPVYSEHWAGHRAVTVIVEPDAITIRRTDTDRPSEPGDEPDDEE